MICSCNYNHATAQNPEPCAKFSPILAMFESKATARRYSRAHQKSCPSPRLCRMTLARNDSEMTAHRICTCRRPNQNGSMGRMSVLER